MQARTADDQAKASSAFAVGLQLIGAFAGLSAFAALCGGALLWLRFDRAHLPADQAVALLPRELLVIVGAHALMLPVVFGLAWAALLSGIGVVKEGSWHTSRFVVPAILALALAIGLAVAHGALLLWLLPAALAGIAAFGLRRAWKLDAARYSEDSPATTWARRWFVVALAGLAAVGAFVMAVGARDLDLGWCLIAVGVAAIGLLAVLTVARNTDRRRDTSWVVFTACVVCGATLALARTAGEPRIEPLALKLSDGKIVAGFQIAHTGDHYYVAPLPVAAFANAEIDSVLEIPRSEVVRTLIGKPAEVEPKDEGRAIAARLGNDLTLRSTAVKEVITPDPVKTFAPLVHLHSDEDLLPMSADDFLRHSALLWAHAGRCGDYSFALGKHVRDGFKTPAAKLGSLPKQAKLGHPPGFVHQQSGARCEDDQGPSYSTTELTRPHDGHRRRRPIGEGEGFYLDLADSARAGMKPADDREGAQRVLPPAPVYWKLQKVGKDRAQIRITYWFLYGLSKPPGPREARWFAHEGDWERISVLLARGRDKGHWLPQEARYHFHDGHQDYPWAALELVQAGADLTATHPVVYSAIGSHASYPRAGSYPQPFRVGGRPAFTVRDRAISCPDCPAWRTWQQLIDASAQPWYGFGGAWGAVGRRPVPSGTTGPLGPSPSKLGKPAGSTRANGVEPPAVGHR